MVRFGTRLARATTVTLVLGALISASPSAASADIAVPLVIAPASGIPTAGRYNVVPQCNAGVGVATSLDEVSYLVVATAESYATDGTPAVATGVYCVIVDDVTGEVYGSTPPTAMPGHMAVSAGVISIPLGSRPKLCGYANALFSNNRTADGTTLGC